MNIESIFNGICPFDLPVATETNAYCDCMTGKANMTCSSDVHLLSCTQPFDLTKLKDEKAKKKKKAKYGMTLICHGNSFLANINLRQLQLY